ncbi:MAG: long-chain fatty acid--CoA ligase, partial [Acidimicrobiales bacterium]
MENNLGLFLTKRAMLNPDMDGVVDIATGRTFSYRTLNERCNQIAHALTALGVTKGDRVALLALNCSEYMETFFALGKIGAVGVPLNVRLVPDELSFILKDAGATVLLYTPEFTASVTALQERGESGTDISTWIQIGGDAKPDFALSYASIQADCSTAEPEIVAADDDLVFIMYTSGTTGLPKGVMHTHNSSIWAAITIGATADMHLDDRFLISLPLFHVGALAPAITAVYQGATPVLARMFDPTQTWEVIGSEKITTTLLVPAMLNVMLSVFDSDKHDLSSLRWCMSGAAPVPVNLIEAYVELGVEIHQVYGLTETCGPACLIGPADAIRKAGSTGQAFFHTNVKVIDADGNECAPNEPGEILVAGPHLMVGYWNRDDATAETMKDGWLHTGDVAIQDEEGFIYIQDRIKDLIISGGENIYPAEIENVILGHDLVGDVAVIARPDEKWGETPLACVVKTDPSLTEQDVLDYCNDKIARFKLPKGVVFVDEIPRNPTGKALKRIL